MTLLEEDAEGNADLLEQIGEKLDRMEPQMFEAKACELLHGLGFDRRMMAKATKDMSGGWRMRVSLAQALFVQPTLLLLDEPTNHLDLGACVWLENYLANYPNTLLMVSHSEDFLNNVCTHTMQLTHDGRLKVGLDCFFPPKFFFGGVGYWRISGSEAEQRAKSSCL